MNSTPKAVNSVTMLMNCWPAESPHTSGICPVTVHCRYKCDSTDDANRAIENQSSFDQCSTHNGYLHICYDPHLGKHILCFCQCTGSQHPLCQKWHSAGQSLDNCVVYCSCDRDRHASKLPASSVPQAIQYNLHQLALLGQDAE